MTRDFQKSKVSKFGKSLAKGKRYNSIDSAIEDLNSMYLQLTDLLSIKNKQIKTIPALQEPHANRTNKSIYSSKRHCIICAVGSLYQRNLIHEMCHALNKQIKKGKRRNIGASHGVNYMTIYIFALAVYMFDGDFDHVEQVAKEHGCKYDKQRLEQLKQRSAS